MGKIDLATVCGRFADGCFAGGRFGAGRFAEGRFADGCFADRMFCRRTFRRIMQKHIQIYNIKHCDTHTHTRTQMASIHVKAIGSAANFFGTCGAVYDIGGAFMQQLSFLPLCDSEFHLKCTGSNR